MKPLCNGSTITDMATNAAQFCRYELKFFLTAEQHTALVNDLRAFLQPDPSAILDRDGRYFVRSLYFDDANFNAYHDKIDGVNIRHIFRLRTYAPDAASTVFLELKARHHLRVDKWRQALSRYDDNNTIASVLAEPVASDIQRRFIAAYRRQHLSALTLIDYWRQPWHSPALPAFRITFDSELAAVASPTLFPTSAARRRSLLRGCTIMEVKYQRSLPDWFQMLRRAHRLSARPLSKLCHAVQAFNLANENEPLS